MDTVSIRPASRRIDAPLHEQKASAFIHSTYGCQVVMSTGEPIVAWSFRIADLQQWITSLEELPVEQRRQFDGLLSHLLAAHNKHKEQDQFVINNAPSAEDLEDYLLDYSAAVRAGL